MSTRVAVVTRDRGRQLDALRTCLGLVLEQHRASLFVLDHAIERTEHMMDNLGFVDEMGGERYSNHPVNIEEHGFRPVSLHEAGRLLAEHELVIPF